MKVVKIAFVITVALSSLTMAKPVEPTQFQANVPDFSATGDADAERLGEAILDAHQRVVAALLRQVDRDEATPDQRAWPVYLLGELRAVPAVPTLLRHIDLKVTKVEPKYKIGRWSSHPAADALAKIGRPASQMILNTLATEPDANRRKLMQGVLYDVEGSELGVYLLQRRVERVQDDQQKRWLLEAIEQLRVLGR